MKYYLCLEEMQFTYICGRCQAEGFVIKKAGSVEISGGSLAENLSSFISASGLKGRRMAVSGIYSESVCKELHLPAASMRLTRQMADNELAYSREKSGPLVTDLDILPHHGNEKERRVLAYAMDKEQLEATVRDLRRSGVCCNRILAMRDCMAKLAYWYRKDPEAAVMVELDQTQVHLRLIREGHCLLSRNIRLNVRHFCEENALDFLYEELADQIRKLMQFYSRKSGADTVRRIFLMPGRTVDVREAAERLQDILEIPVDCLEPRVRCLKGTEPLDLSVYGKALAICAADQLYRRSRTPDLLRARYRALCSDGGLIPAGRTARLLLLAGVNAAAVAGLWLYARANVLEAMDRIQEHEAYMQEDNRQERYQAYLDQEQNVLATGNVEREMKRQELLLRSTNCLSMADYRAVADCLEADMSLESMAYSIETGTLDMTISMSGPDYAPELVERIRLGGHFPGAGHREWRHDLDVWGNDRVYLDFSAVLEAKEDGNDQAQ